MQVRLDSLAGTLAFIANLAKEAITMAVFEPPTRRRASSHATRANFVLLLATISVPSTTTTTAVANTLRISAHSLNEPALRACTLHRAKYR